MTAFLEVWRPAGADLVPLGGNRIVPGLRGDCGGPLDDGPPATSRPERS